MVNALAMKAMVIAVRDRVFDRGLVHVGGGLPGLPMRRPLSMPIVSCL